MKTIYLLAAWGQYRAGTALAVLAEREAPGSASAYVDAVRAQQLLADGLASDQPPARSAARPSFPPVSKEEP